MEKVMVAVSGGVDSGVAASLLREQGLDVSGLFMRHRYQPALDAEEASAALKKWSEHSKLRVCSVARNGSLQQVDWEPDNFPFPLPGDVASAMEISASIGIDLTVVDIDAAFEKVVNDFVERYYSAQTPNPCVLCNGLIKFGLLWDVAQRLGAEYFATGHYVEKRRIGDWLEEQEKRRELGEGRPGEVDEFLEPPDWLKSDPDSTFLVRSNTPKDQSYFLYRVRRDVLNRVIFPVGAYQKQYVRELAARMGMTVARRKDSQEICFIPDHERLNFIRSVRDSEPERWKEIPSDTSGPFLSLDGKVIGRHEGYEKYTIGQRKGLGIGFGERIFVQKILPEIRAVVLGPHEELAVNEIRAIDANWHADVPIDEPFRCVIKIRYRNEATPATVRTMSDGTIVAVPDRPCFGVASGQSLVCYWRDRLLGGGLILL